MATRTQHIAVGVAGVVVQQHAAQQVLRVFPLQIVNASVRRVAVNAAVMCDEFAVVRIALQHLRNGPGIAGPDQRALQPQAVGRLRPVVADREHFQPYAVVPERIADRHQLKRIPEVRSAFGQHVRVIGDAPLQQRHDWRRHVQACAPAALGEIAVDEHPLQPTDVVQMHMGNEDRLRQLAVMSLIGG